MNSETLKRWQAKKLSEGLYPGLNYLARLRGRMDKAGFPPSDKLYQLVQKAYDAMHALSVETHYLSCNGVGRPPRNDAGETE